MSADEAVTRDPGARLLERDEQLSALDEHARKASQDRGRLVLVTGEAGVGKSTLLEAFRSRVTGVEWLQGACDSLFTPRPLGPLYDMADQFGPELIEQVSTGAGRGALFPAVLARVASPDRTSVVVFEDVHWADEATLDLIRYLGRRTPETAALVVVTYRDDAAVGPGLLPEVLGELVRQRSTHRIALSPLSREAVARLCGRSEQEAARLHQLTGGNPFFVQEVLRTGGTTVPPSVRDAVLARISVLSDTARSTLEAAAMVGLRVEHPLLAAIREDPADDLDELLEHGLVLVEHSSARFRHELVRLATAESVSPHRRVMLHHRILGALQEMGTADHARSAYHAAGCRDAGSVLTHAPLAADTAVRMGSHREAAAQYRLALDFSGEAAPATVAALYDGLADVLSKLEEFQAAMEARSQAISHWQEVGDVRREADSLRRQHWVLSASKQAEASLAACRRAIALLAPLGRSPELAWAQGALARVLMVQGAMAQSREWASRAREMAGELGLDDALSDALNTEAAARAAQGLAWEEPMTRALALAESLPDAPLVARAHYNWFCALIMGQRFEEAAAHYPVALAHALEHDLDNYSRWLRREHAVLQLHMGRWDEALAAARIQVDETSESLKNPILPCVVASLVTTRRGEGDDVDEVLDTALRTAELTGMHQYVVPVRVARAEIAWLHGNRESAWKELDMVRDLGVEERRLLELTELWAHRTGLGGKPVGHLDSVRMELDGQHAEAAHAWDQLSCPYDAAMALLGSERETHLREAVVRFEALGATVPARMARQRMRARGYGAIPTGRRASTRAHPKGLTAREQEVLALVAEGLRNRDIADRLFLSPKTVAVHVSSVFRKLGVTSRTEAAAWAHRTARPSS